MTNIVRWPPPQWCPPPDQCDCEDGRPSMPSWGQMQQCWDEVTQFKQFISSVVQSVLASSAAGSLTNPGTTPPSNPQSGTLWYDSSTDQLKAFNGTAWVVAGGSTTLGITDGSNASSGQIGEFVQASTQMAFAAYPNVTTQTINVITLQPGDWDMWGWLEVGPGVVPVGHAGAQVTPIPTGMAGDMSGWAEAANSAISIPLPMARGNFSVATPIPFFVEVNQSTVSTLPAGNITLNFMARRMR